MALARIEVAIISKLIELGKLSEEDAKKILGLEEELLGEQVDKLLIEDYKVS